jgi:hypothetical protein
MTWKHHLRDLILAGGALAAGACSATSDGGGGINFCCNANGDPCCPSDFCGAPVSDACTCKKQGGDWTTPAPDGGFACTMHVVGPGDAGQPDGNSFCCNANPDPCCPSESCGMPETSACTCTKNGGTWDYNATGGGRCEAADAGPGDAAPDDAGQDEGGQDADPGLPDAKR